MGIAASQARFLYLTARNADITRTLSHLSMEKMSLTRESSKLSRDYANALNSKSLKLSYNNGATYVDMTYSNIMSFNVANSNKPIFLTDGNARVVVSDDYLEYAKMLSEYGSPIKVDSWKDWKNSSTRLDMLSKKTGISPEIIQQEYDKTSSSHTITEEQKRQLEFYDTLFFTMAKNGWSYNEKVQDSDYLNETLQNGYFYLTTYEKEEVTDTDGSKLYNITYNTDLAVNNSEVYQVNNSTKNDAALAKYQALKEKLNAKETIIDTRMKNLETEQSANKTIMETLGKTISDNIDRTMNIFA